jgi:hypothetical protein
MRAKHSAGREHHARVPTRFHQCLRVLDMEKRAHTNMPSAASTNNSDPMRSEARLTSGRAAPLVQARQVLAVVPIYQHQVDQPRRELRRGMLVGIFVSASWLTVLSGPATKPTRRLPDSVWEKLRT